LHDVVTQVSNFIDLTWMNMLYLFFVGFVGGLVSCFIGSGGAFVLTPAMMSLGVPGLVAVASNMCHKFPKALIGALKRAKYGQVDVKLGIVLGISAEAGVLYGAHIQENIKKSFGDAGSTLYVSVAFVVILAATIAVGGFIGVPSMIYVLGAPSLMASATELVIAFVMGLGGSFKYALHGLVDIRLSLIILAGSLFGIQLGAIGTTYVKPFVIKLVMGVIMVIVLFSRGLMVPVYLSQLGLIQTLSENTVNLLKTTSFAIMIA